MPADFEELLGRAKLQRECDLPSQQALMEQLERYLDEVETTTDKLRLAVAKLGVTSTRIQLERGAYARDHAPALELIRGGRDDA